MSIGRELVDLAREGKTTQFQQNFNNALKGSIADAITDRRQHVADRIMADGAVDSGEGDEE